MNYSELGDKVKSKYPQYNNVDSNELGVKISDKYPQYKALITEESVSVNKDYNDKKSFFDAVSDFSPVAALSRVAGGGLGQLIKTKPLFTSEQTSEQSPLAGAIQKTGEDITTIPAHFFNQLALNAPRSLMNTFTNIKYPEDTDNKLAGVLAKASGVAGAVTSPIAKLLGSAIKAGKYGSSAAGGALLGAAYSPTEDFGDIKERAVGGAVGGVVGPLVTGAVSIGSKVPKKLSEVFGSAKKLDQAKVLKQSLVNDAENIKIKQRDAFERLNDASVNDAIRYKNVLKPLSRQNSLIYRKGLEKAEQSFEFDSSNLKSLVDDSLSELSEQGIGSDSEVFNRLSKISEELAPKSKQVFDYAAQQEVSRLDPVKKLTLEEVKRIKSDIFNSADKSSNYKDDIANAIFSKNYGAKISSNNPEFQIMQNEYAPYVEAKKWAYRVFKPQTAEEIPNGYAVLKRVAKGTANEVDYAYLTRLESGSPQGMFKGTGNLRSESQSLGNELKNISNEIKSVQASKIKNTQDIQRLERLKNQRKYYILGALTSIGALAGLGNKSRGVVGTFSSLTE